MSAPVLPPGPSAAPRLELVRWWSSDSLSVSKVWSDTSTATAPRPGDPLLFLSNAVH